MKNLLSAKTLFILLTVILSVSCQPPGGDLVPIPLDGATVGSYFDKKNVVQVYDDDLVKLKMYGEWKPEGGIFYLNLELTNKSQKVLELDFSKWNFQATFDEKVDFGYLMERKNDNSAWEIIGNGKLIIQAGKSEYIVIASGMPELTGKIMPKSFYLGKKIFIDIPVVSEESLEENYKFAFKYDNYQ